MESICPVFNKFRLCTSYDEMQEIDFGVAQSVIDTTNFYRAPVHSTIESYNHFHNILILFDDLPNFPFITSETMRNYYL